MRHGATQRTSATVAACLAGALSAAGPCLAAGPEPEDSGWAFFIDNEFLALDSWTQVNDDRNYTMGLAGALGGSRFAKGWLGAPRNFVDRLLGTHAENPSTTHHALVFGVTAFTPNDLENPAPIPFDRPYAGLAFIANQKTSADSDSETAASRSMLVVGALGLDIAKSVQRSLHNKVGVSSQDPLGWDNQISEGGELTALYAADRLKLIRSGGSLYDLTGNLGYKAGYYTGMTAGFDFRLGRIGSAFYEHSPNPMANFSQWIFKKKPSESNKDFYAFLSYQATLVGYNALLQGQVRKSAQTFSGSQIERLVHWAGLGFVYEFGYVKLTYTFNYRSAEFKGPEARAHYWGGVYLTFDH